MPVKPTQISLSEMLRQAASDLKTVAKKPNILTAKPHEKQMSFFQSTLREKLFIGGNRSGKTWGNVLECCWWLTKKHPHRPDVNAIEEPIRGRYVSVDFKYGIEQIALPYFKQFLPASELVGGSWEKSYDGYRKILTLANGSTVEFMSYEQDLDTFAGTSRHFCAFDEEPPMTIFVECRFRLVDTEGSWWISMTPVEGITWIYDSIVDPSEKGLRPQTLVLKINTDENPHVKASEMDAASEIGLSEADKRARREGGFDLSGTRVFPEYRPGLHMREDFQLTRDMLIYTSYDHGWRHPAAWLWHAVEPNGRVTTFNEIILSEKTIADLAELVKRFEEQTLAPVGLEVFARPCDPACSQTSAINGMSIVTEYAKHGLYLSTENIPRGDGSVKLGLDKIHQYLKLDPDLDIPMWSLTPNCKILNDQMIKIRWKKWASKKLEYENGPQDRIHKINDDGPDSLRYFFTLMPDLYVKMEGKEVRIRREIGNMRAAQPLVPVALRTDVMGNVPDSVGNYRVYEGSDLYALENY